MQVKRYPSSVPPTSFFPWPYGEDRISNGLRHARDVRRAFVGEVLGAGRAGLVAARRQFAPIRDVGVPAQHTAQHTLIVAEREQVGPRTRLERVCFPGVSAASPLGRAIDRALAGQVDAIYAADVGPAVGPWRHTVASTALRWWSGAGMPPVAVGGAADPDIVVDLHATVATGSGRRWRLVDGSGAPLLACFHALGCCHRAPFTASLFLIEQLGAGDAGTVLAEAHLSSAVSYRKLLDALGQAACDLLRAGFRASGPGRPWVALAPPRLRSQWLSRARCRARETTSWVRARLGGDLYGIAVLLATKGSLLQDAVIAPDHWISVPAREGFIADPFFWPGRPDVVLCEYYAHATGRGVLSAVPIAPTPAPASVRSVLEADHHLSYPFTFVDGERVLCLPEMAAARRQVLYEVRADGSLSTLCTVANDVAMADPTLTRHDGLYWIAYTDADRNAYDNLCLMFAADLTGPWTRHPGNPVKIDVRSSRPGGAPFLVDGVWYRPAQDCSRTYGGALTINAVQTWTCEHFAEIAVATLRPDPGGPYPDGLHTVSQQGGRILIDGKRISYHPAIVWNKLRRRFVALATGE